mgnify:CR=1 FL=1
MNNNQKQRLLSLFDDKDISQDDRNFWISRLENTSDMIAENIIALFEAFPDEIQWFYDIQRRKETALAAPDRNAWVDILKEEEKHVNSLSVAAGEET